MLIVGIRSGHVLAIASPVWHATGQRTLTEFKKGMS